MSNVRTIYPGGADRAYATLPHGVALPTLIGQPASLAAQFDDLLAVGRPAPEPRRLRPTWTGTVTAFLLGGAAGYLGGLFAVVIL